MIRSALVLVTVGWLVALGVSGTRGAEETRLLRFPDIHGKQIVFTYAGDLWRVDREGGTARRLTAHPGIELFAKFSPDGKWIAFTGQYDGDEQVYVMPAEGGTPRQLTFYPARGPLPDRWGFDNHVCGWSPDGKRILFRCLRDGWSLAGSRLYTVSRDGGLPAALPMPTAGLGDFAPDGKHVVYSPLFRDFRTWKRYEGGWAQDLYIFDLESHDQVRITEHPRSDRDPMWIGGTVYFTSDRSGTLNLYGYDVKKKSLNQLTDSTTFDVRWPSGCADGQIVYELAGQLHVLDTKSRRDRPVSVRVPTDALARRPRHISLSDYIEGFNISPDGKRVLFVARGDIFSAPAEKGPTRNLTRSSNAHDKWAAWSPDGSQIAFISDRDGEEELYLVDPLGHKSPAQLTDGGTAMRYEPSWSPDGRRIAFSDKDGKLYVVTVADRRMVQVADERHGQVRDYVWSPRGGHLAFSLDADNDFGSIYIWSVKDEKLRKITDDQFNDFNPAWDPEGNYLFFLSDREFAPQIGSFEWNYVVDRETGIFALALRADVPHPFPPESDEVEIKKDEDDSSKKANETGSTEGKETSQHEGAPEEEKKPAEGEAKKDESKEFLKIDFEGLGNRIVPVPVSAENYGNLSSIKGHLLYVRRGASYYGRGSDVSPELRIFSIKERKETTLAEKVSGYVVSADGKKLLVRQSGSFTIFDATPQGKGSGKTVSTSGLSATIDPVQEWRQIFHEVWRRYRDFFYVSNMHGYDWAALRDRYEPLLDHVAHRSDLSYIINEMISELNVGHAYNSGGDFEQPARPDVALPGARFELDPRTRRYRIRKIFAGDNAEKQYRSPLTEVGVNVHEGDYVLAIDGEPLTANVNPYRLLRYKSKYPVTLTVASNAGGTESREVVFRPITSEHKLIYMDWVAGNRRRVEEATDGRVGYLHLPDMGSDGIWEFNKWFYGQVRKEGLIIDVRGNGGGNVSQMLINRLRRTLLATGFSRTNDTARTYPETVFHGHLVCLINETSASDGDIFPAMFREAGLGPLIGKRTWGGVIGITNRGTLIDGGTIYVPEFGFASKEGQWILEGRGVEPDIVVENEPQAVLKGEDAQLERGIREVLKRVRRRPRHLPSRPPAPVKTP